MNYLYFITVIAWPVVIWSICLLLATLWCDFEYNMGKDGKGSIEKMFDNMKGMNRNFYYKKYTILSLFSFSWLVSYYFA
jgi:hypothetical protein